MTRGRCAAALVATALGALLVTTPGCARPGSPRGGVPDRRPPVVIATEPVDKALVVNPDATIRFHFNERVSERPSRGALDDAVLVSPATGAVHVQHGSDWIGVKIDGGLKPKAVYRITLLPVIADLFNNSMRDPFEIVFSTGGQVIENAYSGQALDRITGRPMPDLTVELLPRAPQPDTLVFIARTNEQGLYFFRYVPPGVFDVVAFQDQNRNRLPDRREPSGRRAVRISEGPDTVFPIDVAVLEPDTTAATLVRAEVLDSVTARLVFSDYLDPQDVSSIGVSLTAPEGRSAPPVKAVLHPAVHDAERDTAKARALRSAVGAALAVPGQERGGMPPGLPLPRQEAIVELTAPLELDVVYRVSVQSVTNINGVPLGRGDTTLVRKAPPPEPAAAPGGRDAAGRPAIGITREALDSLARLAAPRPDSGVARPAAPRPDSAAVRPDTLQVVLRTLPTDGSRRRGSR